MTSKKLPIGKLPPDILSKLLKAAPLLDQRVILGPGIGIDCAVVDMGDRLLVFKSDPITFATNEIGWYAVQVSSNDIATTGATPCWYLVTALLPENTTDESLVQTISNQIYNACREKGISVIGGHTEITYGIHRPIVVGTLIGEVTRERLIMPCGATPGDRLLLTKGVPIEAAAILAREFPQRLLPKLGAAEIQEAADYLYQPGISILRDAQIALAAGRVTAMHDPTEGGLASALWEMAEASGRTLVFHPNQVPVPPLASRICRVFGLDPLACIASGALLMSVVDHDADAICSALNAAGIACREIGRVEEGAAQVLQENPSGRYRYPRPERDEITKVYE
ncbi:MAG: AIR synthase [Anaerolineae bacterium]|nr:AIR synthase [Anaerolineae bacterium]